MSHCANAVSCKKACIHWLATTALIERKVKVELCLTQKIIYGSFKDCILASSRQTPKNIRASRNHGRGTLVVKKVLCLFLCHQKECYFNT